MPVCKGLNTTYGLISEFSFSHGDRFVWCLSSQTIQIIFMMEQCRSFFHISLAPFKLLNSSSRRNSSCFEIRPLDLVS